MEWTCLIVLAVALIQMTKGDENEGPVQGSASVGTKEIDKRVPCAAKFYQFNPRHTACLRSGRNGPQDGVPPRDRRLIEDTHNVYRSKQYATNMEKMYWDSELAMIAQKWADNCDYKHDSSDQRNIPKRMSVGQNIAMDTYAKKDWKKPMAMWYGEIKDFTYGGSNVFHKVGHFTQIVWAETPLIGCGYARCPANAQFSGPWNFYVCNYGPGGNLYDRISRPYKEGPRGSDCMKSENGLCDCKGRLCMNGGTLDVGTCKCKCLNVPWVMQPDCTVECTKAEDTDFCNGAFGPNPCQYSNVPLEYCPKLCNLC
ncbi:serotriflin-like [Lineus longissimus]|uniref:serotriflin-like n=1 Tax=Lineus longissimus TaxID=88925 RepID=UPI002B4C2D5D